MDHVRRAPVAIALNPALRAPVTDRKSAEAFIRALNDAGLMYHFDDGAEDCLFANGACTREAAEFIDSQVDACYAAWKASGADMSKDCPIGYALRLDPVSALNVAPLVEQGVEPAPRSASTARSAARSRPRAEARVSGLAAVPPSPAPRPGRGARETRVVFVDVAGVGTGPAEVLKAYPDGDLLVRYRGGHCYVVSPRGRG